MSDKDQTGSIQVYEDDPIFTEGTWYCETCLKRHEANEKCPAEEEPGRNE